MIIIVNQSDPRQQVEFCLFFSFLLIGHLDLEVKKVQHNLICFVLLSGGHLLVNREVTIGGINDTAQMSDVTSLPL